MCTIGRTAGGTACKAHHRTDRTQYPLRYGQERKDYGTEGCRSSFLNATFQPNLCRVLSWKIPTGKGTISSRGTTTGSCVTPSSDMPI